MADDKKVTRFPVNPEEFSIDYGAENKTADVLNLLIVGTLDFSNNASEVTVEWSRNGSCGKISFTLRLDKPIEIKPASVVNFSADGVPIFYGFVFTVSIKNNYEYEVLACDQLRYLKANDSFLLSGKTAGEIIKTIAARFNLKTGAIADTAYKIPGFLCENKSCLEIISEAVSQTILATNKIYVFYDNVGKLELAEAEKQGVDTVLGNKSYVTNYTYGMDIDKDTYNQIKLARPNEETGKTEIYIAKDSETIKEWGFLQVYQTVDKDMNPAMVKENAEQMLKYYNSVKKTLSLDSCLGVLGVRGCRATSIAPQY